MKNKMVIIGMLLVVGLLFMGPVNVQAADTISDASIGMVGVYLSNSAITLTHVPTSGSPVYTNIWFNFNKLYKKEMLATALTALSLGKNVKIGADMETKTINSIRVLND